MYIPFKITYVVLALATIVVTLTGCQTLDTPKLVQTLPIVEQPLIIPANTSIFTPSQIPVAEPAAISTSTPQSEPWPNSASDSAAKVPGPNEVWIWTDHYWPDVIRVPVGTTVVWTNKQGDSHDVWSETNLFGFADIPTGISYNFTFDSTGIFNYYCGCSGMQGQVIVQPGPQVNVTPPNNKYKMGFQVKLNFDQLSSLKLALGFVRFSN